jgi:hypothetical protein
MKRGAAVRRNQRIVQRLLVECLEPRRLLSFTAAELVGPTTLGRTLSYQISNGTEVTANVVETYVASGNAGVIEKDSVSTGVASGTVVETQEFYRFTSDGFVDTGGNTIVTSANGTVRQNETDSHVPSLVVYPPTVTAENTLTQTVTNTGVDNLHPGTAGTTITETDSTMLSPGQPMTLMVTAGRFTNVFLFLETQRVTEPDGTVNTSNTQAFVQPGVGLIKAVTTAGGETASEELISTNDAPASGGLTPSIGADTVPATAVSGQAIKGNVTVDVAGAAGAAGKAAGTVALYATASGSIDSSATLIPNTTKKVSVKGSATVKLTLSIKNFSLLAGTYTILARVTDGSGNVTDTISGPTITVSPARVDLSTSTVSAVSPASPKAGKTATITVVVNNTGNSSTTAATSIVVGFSVDGVTVAAPLTNATVKAGIKVGKAAKVKLKFKVPAGVVTGETLVAITEDGVTTTLVGPAFTVAA